MYDVGCGWLGKKAPNGRAWSQGDGGIRPEFLKDHSICDASDGFNSVLFFVLLNGRCDDLLVILPSVQEPPRYWRLT
jgi:hypothetical protein